VLQPSRMSPAQRKQINESKLDHTSCRTGGPPRCGSPPARARWQRDRQSEASVFGWPRFGSGLVGEAFTERIFRLRGIKLSLGNRIR
jgi:hypothetical protein